MVAVFELNRLLGLDQEIIFARHFLPEIVVGSNTAKRTEFRAGHGAFRSAMLRFVDVDYDAVLVRLFGGFSFRVHMFA